MKFELRSPGGHFLLLTAALIGGLALAGCGGGEPADEAAAPAGEPAEPAGEPAQPAEGAETVSYDPALLEAPGRTEDDHYRDEGFKPLEVYSFFGVEPGMTVGDLATSGMYNAHILAQIVGDEGQVYAIVGYRDTIRDGQMERVQSTLDERNVEGSLSNVEVVATLEDLPEESLDILITVRNYHDIGDHQERLANVPRFLRVLKPGGILGVVDAHTDEPDERDESTHRINEELARQEIVEGGFEFVASSDVLHNPDDTYDFDGREGLRTPDDPSDDAPIHRYFIHRWVAKFHKPAGGM